MPNHRFEHDPAIHYPAHSSKPGLDLAVRVLELVVVVVPPREGRAARDGVRGVVHAIEQKGSERVRREELARRLRGRGGWRNTLSSWRAGSRG